MALEYSRAGLRGLLCAAAVGLAVSSTSGHLPVVSAIYVGLLLAPTSLVESWLVRRGTAGYGTVIVAWLVLFALVALMHFQAVYGSGVVSSGTLEGGAEALLLERNRLYQLAPGELGSLAGVHNLDLLASAVAGAAIAFFCAALARPLAVAWFTVVKLWVVLAAGGLLLGTFTVIAVLAWLEGPAMGVFAPHVAMFVGGDTVGPLAGTLLAWVLGDLAAEWPVRAVRRR